MDDSKVAAPLQTAQEADGALESCEIRRIRSVYAERERRGMHQWDAENAGRKKVLRERDKMLARSLGRYLSRPLCECRVLDLGCGYGTWLNWFHEQGVAADHLFGVDLLEHRVEIARRSYPSFRFNVANAEQLAFEDGVFDLILIGTLFSSVFDADVARAISNSVVRVLKPDGFVVWWDIRYPNPSNHNVRAMTKRRIKELFPSFELELQRLGMIPPIAQRLGRMTESVYPVLAAIPVLRSHYFGFLWPRQTSRHDADARRQTGWMRASERFPNEGPPATP